MRPELPFLSIAEAGRLLRRRDISAVELTRACLARIDALDSTLHSFIRLTSDDALAQAEYLDRELAAGRQRGPLHGIPVGLKDVYETQGIATTAGSRAFIDHVPRADAEAVKRLKEAGAVILGKLATHELTYGGVSFDLPWPPARNPWNPEHDPGGSSTGPGAAVAAGFVLAALGTDTGGSIRIPAAHSGVVGLKPTYGRVSRTGAILNSFTLDHCGPLAWTVEDCAIALQAVAGFDPADRGSADAPVPDFRAGLSQPIAGLRIGVVRHFYEADVPAGREVRSAMEEALRTLAALGARLEDVRLPSLLDFAAAKVIIQCPEIYAVHAARFEARPKDFGRKLLERIRPARGISAVDYLRAQERRRELAERTAAAMEPFDLLVTATTPEPAPKLADAAAATELNVPEITVAFSMTGQPAISICNGFTDDGLPLGMQIVGKPFGESTVLRAAYAYELATPWRQRPSLAITMRPSTTAMAAKT